jgi:hypothetical protein
MTDPHAELEIAQRYAAGLLDATDAATFEDHLLTCEQCQAEVRLTVGVRRLVRDTPATSRSRGTRWIVGAAVLLAAGITAVVILPGSVDRELADLGRVTAPPAYIGMSVRSSPQRGDSLFASAMTAYLDKRYDDAVSGLRAALTSGVDTIPTRFFLASAELMAGHPREAAVEFARVIAAGTAASAYLPEAHLYRARAFLRLGRATDALAELGAVGQADAVNGARAAALADSVTQVMRR